MRRPSNNNITMQFGATDAPYTPSNPHKGTDFSYIPDDTIYAPFAGKVTQVPNNGNDGNATYMTDGEGRFHGFLHASRYLVPNGSNVAEGQAIAVMGESGYTFGKHLHWAVKQNGQFIDPMSIISEEPPMPTKPTSQQIVDADLVIANCEVGGDFHPDDQFVKDRIGAGQTALESVREIGASSQRAKIMADADFGRKARAAGFDPSNPNPVYEKVGVIDGKDIYRKK